MRILLSCILALCFTGAAFAKTPAEIMTHYKAYRTALESKNYDKAEKAAKLAWETAEELLGDHKTTGDLAQNFADIARVNNGKFKDIDRAYIRSIDVIKSQNPELALQRESSLGAFYIKTGKPRKLKKRFEEAVVFAENNGLENSTFLGELYTVRSQVEISKSNHEDTEKYAEKALEIFEKSEDGFETYHPYMARLYSGYGKEGQKDFVPAIMEYQDVMQNLEGDLPKDHPFMMRALGRWMLMRNRVVREGLKDEAEAAGMCECWPYDKPRNEAVKPVKRVPGMMPRQATQSGFVIVEFDLADDGSVVEPRVLEAWPEDMFDKSTLSAVAKWKYTPRTADEVDSDRTDIITTVRYMLKDHNGNVIE